MANQTKAQLRSRSKPVEDPSPIRRKSAVLDVSKQPYHIRYQIENPEDLEALVDERLESMGYMRKDLDPGIVGMIEQRILSNRAIDALRVRLQENSNNSPHLIAWGEDLLDVIKAINNA